MSNKLAITTNTLYQLLAKLVSTVSTLIISIFITRVLGASTWGEYSIVMAYVTFFYLFTEFGLNGIAARDFSKKKDIKLSEFLNFYAVRALNTIFVVIISILSLYFINYSYVVKQAIFLTQVGLFLFSLSSAFNVLFQAKLLYKYLFFITLVFSITHLLLFTSFLRLELTNPIIYLFIPQVIADGMRFIVSLCFASTILIKDKIAFQTAKMKYFFITSVPLGLALVFNTLMSQIDKILLSVMVDELYLGYYSLSYKLFDVLLVLPTFFMNAAFTIWVKSFNNKKEYNRIFSLSVYALIIISILITVVSLGVSWFFIPLIWGTEMSFSIVSFNILISGAILFYISSPISWAYVVENKQKYLVYFYCVGFILNVVLNLLLIKKYNYVGAAWATLISEAFILLLLELYRRRFLSVKYVKADFFNALKLFKKNA